MGRFRFASTLTMSFAMVGLLGAQAAPPTAPQTPAAPAAEQPTARDAGEMTIVGCLAQSTTANEAYALTITPTADAVGAASPAGAATDVARAGAPGAPSSDAARTVGRPSATAPTTYTIVGIAADQLKPHVNHQVELKGRVGIAAAAAAATQSANAAKEFRATSVKMLNATCPPAK